MPVFERLKARLRERKCESPIEEMVCDCLSRLGIPFRVQEPIGPYFADIFIPDLNKVIECDGAAYHQDISRELKRDEFIRSQGYSIHHIRGKEIVADPMKSTFDIIKGVQPRPRRIMEKEWCPFRQGYFGADEQEELLEIEL